MLEPSELLGSTDLISHFNLNGCYKKYSVQRKIKEDLASFLPQICSSANLNATKTDNWWCSNLLMIENFEFKIDIINLNHEKILHIPHLLLINNFSSLKNLVEKPQITGREIIGLSSSAMTGFKLIPGSVSDSWRLFDFSERNDLNSLLSSDQTRGFKRTLDELHLEGSKT